MKQAQPTEAAYWSYVEQLLIEGAHKGLPYRPPALRILTTGEGASLPEFKHALKTALCNFSVTDLTEPQLSDYTAARGAAFGGSLGAALALAFHAKGHKVFASARDLSKTSSLQQAGIQCLELDVLSAESIDAAKTKISDETSGSIDILINNAGGGHYMPFMHLDLQKARELFDINVWSYLSVTQAFLPLLLRDKSVAGQESLLVNNTSISSVLRTPFHSAYSASKAAMAMFSEIQRIELQPLGIRVIDLKTGSLESNFGPNRTNEIDLPADSPYQPIKDEVTNVISGATTEAYAEDQESWAKNVVEDLLKKNPPAEIWRGGMAGTIQLTSKIETVVPTGLQDKQFQRLGGLDKLEKIMREKEA
ncbi:Putative short-chain dehydrogenase/reductase SDR, NAD(P)-binding domain superfamily [Septoria linicola]|uniref:Short-chain dehydrogenase/reductase SDR, NAD(P)-binding domain superfamily n=1 Tax=Septoria linicola TaxID=215465 RepID=A0A9Q9B047_9PEZI|nr:putative short-chain dehydrogenase/reductase SDR, NAD(P)-binding domain superfamily [Septoria linicola]USW58549.1 Putative short-chain dehydrogenase/reductase SDR, NAD(P)-binding domain superfamily [Septoria linicola]